jgi:hypothetical protein
MAQEIHINQDESKVPAYSLPNPLRCADGSPVVDSKQWTETRRTELLRLFETHVYGRMPARHPEQKFNVVSEKPDALGGKALRKEILVLFNGRDDGPSMRLLVYIPRAATKPIPVFLGLNFGGNQAIEPDPSITMPQGWMLSNDAANGYVDHRATERSRGVDAGRWPLERIIASGFGVATAYYGDIDPDFDDGFKNGVHPLFDEASANRPLDAWGSISAWAWGLSRALDALETQPAVDSKHVALLGHSRLGKTALWAGASDPRFAIVISNESGEGGAALARRRFGETVHRINASFPHWFCGNFKKYNDREDDLPIDQHELIALIAPRPVLICSAAEDLWADPKGEFLSAAAADPVYRLFGVKGIDEREMPPVGKLVGSSIGYHIRAGKHDVTEADWSVFLAFAKRHFENHVAASAP